MADQSKLEKIAAAKRRLKEFQSRQQQPEQVQQHSQSLAPPPHQEHELQIQQQAHQQEVQPAPPTQQQQQPEPLLDNNNLTQNQSPAQFFNQNQFNNTQERNTIFPNIDDNNSHQLQHNFQNKISDSFSNNMPNTFFQPASNNNIIPFQHQSYLTDVSHPQQTPSISPPPPPPHQPKLVQDPSILEDLNIEKQRNVELNIQLLHQNSQIEKLHMELEKVKLDNSTKVTLEIGPLQEQLQSHVQTIGILVGEKAELSAALAKYQSMAQGKVTEIEELQARLTASRHRVQVLEKEMATLKSSYEKYDSSQQKLCTELENTQENMTKMRKQAEDSSEEIAELKRKLSMKNKDISELENVVAKTKSDLSLSQLRVEQFSAGDSLEADTKVETLTQQKLFYESKVQELQKSIQQIGAERDQASQQYQNYVQQQNKEIANLAEQLQHFTVDNERLTKREESLVKHIGELERQIQQQISKQKSFKEVHQEVTKDNNNAANKLLNEEALTSKQLKCDQLESEKLTLEQHLQTKSSEFTALQYQYQEKLEIIHNLESTLERVQADRPDSKNLLASMESDKVAAARAVAQNQELKQQLEEIQRAFVQLSNDKLELTDKLQSEQHLGRENKLKAGNLDHELHSIKEKLHFKDEEMIRLSHENEELNKQILKHSVELDRLRHYETRGQENAILQKKLQQQKESVRLLKQQLLQQQQQQQSTTEINSTAELDASNDNETQQQQQQQTVDVLSNDIVEHTPVLLLPDENEPDDDNASTSTVNIATEEAMDKLQERFTRTMSDVADLTEEKNRLEHIVMQLQSETETIGEYITLYQNQRRLLKQREVEKDVQLQHIIKDREEMKNKLQKLNQLVEQLLLQKGHSTPVENIQHLQPNTDAAALSNGYEQHEQAPLIEESHNVNQENINPKSSETASKILNLLSEIQDQNQNKSYVNSDVSISDLHHCSCCYGKLETV